MGAELAELTAAQQALAEVETPAEAKVLYDQLDALSKYVRSFGEDQEKQNEIALVKLRTARKGGELLDKTIEHKGGRLAAATAAKLPDGLSQAMSSRWQAIRPEALPDEKFENHAKAVVEAGEDLTLSGVLALARKLAGKSETPPLPTGQWRAIVADPPWPYEGVVVRPDKTGPRAPGTERLGAVPFPYPTMAVEDIALLEVEERAAEDAHLYLWTTNKFLEAAYDVARAWGFKPSTLLVWCKPPMGIGLGGTFTITTEYVLFARRGTLKAEERIDTTWFGWKRQPRHSVKPSELQELVERITPGPGSSCSPAAAGQVGGGGDPR